MVYSEAYQPPTSLNHTSTSRFLESICSFSVLALCALTRAAAVAGPPNFALPWAGALLILGDTGHHGVNVLTAPGPREKLAFLQEETTQYEGAILCLFVFDCDTKS